MSDKIKHIRNFAIIAHIDHGKSTLSDRLIQYCGGLTEREMQNQVLDSMDLEKEKGITIKAQTVRLNYEADDGNMYQLNLIDTPGHVDFTYEVSRSLSACEGSILVVDASQGVEAQTLANLYLALERDHEIIPVINKIDLPAAEPDQVANEIEEVIGIDTSNKILISAKQGIGTKELLESIVKYLPAPNKALNDRELKALLIDSWYDPYLGVVILLRIYSGKISKGMSIRMMSSGVKYVVDNVGYFSPKKNISDKLISGEVGFITASIKNLSDCRVGDTITEDAKPCKEALSGFKRNLAVVFCGLYPLDASEYAHLKDSLAKLKLNDASIEYENESSQALGLGFKCGFLGLLHLEIVKERLEREYNLELITTAPSVVYEVLLKDGTELTIHSPSDLPEMHLVEHIKEPWLIANIMVPDKYLGNVLELCTEKRGIQVNLSYVGARVLIVYRLPLNEVVFDFYDKLKSCSKGYASFDWKIDDYQIGQLVRLNILVNSDAVDALTMVVHKTRAESRGRAMCLKLKELIPRQLFQVPIQAAIGSKIIARETIPALRKDVLSKCYGGDISRKRKLLEKQKAGKKRMKNFGNVEIPSSVFIEALKEGGK